MGSHGSQSRWRVDWRCSNLRIRYHRLVSGPLPLSALLSQALVAYTIEFDNEFELRTPHRTTDFGSTGPAGSPWLVSLPMYAHFLQFVPEQGITIRELFQLTRLDKKALENWLTRLSKWWGYLEIRSGADTGAPRGKVSPGDWLVRPTTGGKKALEVWRPLFTEIEARWEKRFGKSEIATLRESLIAIRDKLGADLPDCLPVLGYDLFTARREKEKRPASATPEPARPVTEIHSTLPALLSQVLYAFALEFERDSAVSLAIQANVLRLAHENGVPLGDLPRLSGVSKEAIAMATGFLEKARFAATKTSLGLKTKILTLTQMGTQIQKSYCERASSIEEDWRGRFTGKAIRHLREPLDHLIGAVSGDNLLLRGLEAPAGTWRASLSKPEALPHYPMVLHRGGFPDGS
jgi:hypothetical protein